jgi:predicted dehydrogenase
MLESSQSPLPVDHASVDRLLADRLSADRDRPVGIAVLGLGRWGIHWLRNFLAAPKARVVSVADAWPASLEKVAALMPAEMPFLTTDWQAAIAQPGVEAVVIVTPAVTHFELITTALELGLHVLVEKPITVNSQEAIAASELADRQNKILMVDHTYLFNPAIQRGRSAIAAGICGEWRYAYGTRSHLGPVRQDVDVMWDLAIHDVVILNHWLGQLPVKVQAKATSWLQDSGLADTVWGTLTYPNGFEATMHWSWLNNDKQRRVGVVGQQGTLIFDELAAEPLVCHQGQFAIQPQGFVPIEQNRQVLTYPVEEPLANACQHFLDCIRQQQPSNIANGWHGVELVQILESLAASMAQNGEPITIEYCRQPLSVMVKS